MIPQHCQAIIFDMDGVLWHSADAHEESFRQVLNDEGLTMPAYSKLAGRRTDEVMRELLELQKGGVDLDQLRRMTFAKQALANKLLMQSAPVAAMCFDVLQKLAQSFRIVLASSGSKQNVQLFLDTCGAKNLFEFALSGNDVQSAKPSPDIYLLALNMLKLPANLCLVVEDSFSGIEAARKAGIPCVAITGTHSHKELEQCPVQSVIDKLEELCQ